MKKHIEMTGKRFGRITVIAPAGFSATNRHRRWLCVCDCGAKKEISGTSLRSGVTSSCGCLAIERTKDSNTTHGLTLNRTHRIWKGMLRRCENPNSDAYANYGGRGIKVCPEWHSFECFLKDMGSAPDGLSIERKDNNGNYEKDNCKWATAIEQARNKRTVRKIEAFGESLTTPEWSERTGIPDRVIRDRIIKLNWNPERALQLPQ